MNKTLGIYVTSERHIDELLAVCRAADRKGVAVHVFLTHRATALGLDPRVKELAAFAKVALCKVGFESSGLDKRRAMVDEKAFASQSWHAEMIYACDRYLTF